MSIITFINLILRKGKLPNQIFSKVENLNKHIFCNSYLILSNLQTILPTYFSGSGLSTFACSQMMGSTPSEEKTSNTSKQILNKLLNLSESDTNAATFIYLLGHFAEAVWAVLERALCAWWTWSLQAVWAGFWRWPAPDNPRVWWKESAWRCHWENAPPHKWPPLSWKTQSISRLQMCSRRACTADMLWGSNV